MGFRGYLIKRTINTLILILFVIVLNFIIFELMPGDQGSISALTNNPKIPPDVKKVFVFNEGKRLGLFCGGTPDNPLPCSIFDKFSRYFIAMVTFNFGISFQSGQPVIHDIVQSGRLVNTLELLGVSSVLAIVLGIFIGTIAAKKRGSLLDSGSVFMSLTTFSLPTFWMGLVLITIFS